MTEKSSKYGRNSWFSPMFSVNCSYNVNTCNLNAGFWYISLILSFLLDIWLKGRQNCLWKVVFTVKVPLPVQDISRATLSPRESPLTGYQNTAAAQRNWRNRCQSSQGKTPCRYEVATGLYAFKSAQNTWRVEKAWQYGNSGRWWWSTQGETMRQKCRQLILQLS